MKKLLLCLFLVTLLLPVFSACGGKGGESNVTTATPAIAKVRLWLTLTNSPDAAAVTTLTPEQTAQASIWARGTTEENLTFKVNLEYNGKLTTLASGVRTEGASKATAVGGFAAPLEAGKYTFKALTGATGTVIGSLEINVVSSLSTTSPSAQASVTSAPSSTLAPALSEQPDKATYQKYFSELGIGKMPAEVKNSPMDLQKDVNVFTKGDQICLYGTIILECQVQSSVYDVAAKKVVKSGGLPKPMTGGFAGWEPLDLAVGKYEYKVYVGDALVGVFPFEVR
jgi:hypothetical protein